MFTPPATIEITTVIGCALRCRFCPQDLLIERYRQRSTVKRLDFSTFKTCLDKIPAEVQVHFSGMAEPWLNPECTEMLLYAHGKGHPLVVYSTLVGMKKEDFYRIKKVDFKTFVVHLPDSDRNSPIPLTDAYWGLLEEVIGHFGSPDRKKVFGASCHGAPNRRVMDRFPSNFFAPGETQGLVTRIIDRAGRLNDPEAPQRVSTDAFLQCGLCGRTFHRNVLLPDGSVLLCCMDYGLDYIFGNLLFQNYEEIFKTREFASFYEALDEDREVICRRCSNAVAWNPPYTARKPRTVLDDPAAPRYQRFAARLAGKSDSARVWLFSGDKPFSYARQPKSTPVAIIPDLNILGHPGSPPWSSLSAMMDTLSLAVLVQPRPELQRLPAADRRAILNEFGALLRSRGVHVEFLGWDLWTPDETLMLAVAANNHCPPLQPAPGDFQVIALTAIYNEADIIRNSIEQLINSGIDVYIIDNWSTDGSYEIAAGFLGRGVFGLERFPPGGPSAVHDWEKILRRKEELAKELAGDWFIHNDADEIRESPWPNQSLKDAIYRVDRLGYNTIDFTVLEFKPIDNGYRADEPLQTQFNFFEFGTRPGFFNQQRVWKKTDETVNLADTGGHVVQFQGKNVFPFKFLLRHYPIRNQDQGTNKILDRQRRWHKEKQEKGWHYHYELYEKKTKLLSHPYELLFFDDAFYEDYLIERLTGEGIDPAINRSPKATPATFLLPFTPAGPGPPPPGAKEIDGANTVNRETPCRNSILPPPLKPAEESGPAVKGSAFEYFLTITSNRLNMKSMKFSTGDILGVILKNFLRRPTIAQVRKLREYIYVMNSNCFDHFFYLFNYPDVSASGVNPLWHYLKYGAQEGRDPHPFFNTTFYLRAYPDVALSGNNPFFHFLKYGIKEKRNIVISHFTPTLKIPV